MFQSVYGCANNIAGTLLDLASRNAKGQLHSFFHVFGGIFNMTATTLYIFARAFYGITGS